MTSEEFLKLLNSKLDFMEYKDKVKILSFYSDKILAAQNPEEEQRITDSFGNIDDITDKIKLKYDELTKFRNRGDTISFSPEIINNLASNNDIPNNEAFTNPSLSLDTKEETKTKTFQHIDEIENPVNQINLNELDTVATKKINNPNISYKDKRRNPVREINHNKDENKANKNKKSELWLPDTNGLFGIILEKSNVSPKARPAVFALLFIFFLPLLITLTALLCILYIASFAIIFAVALCLFIIVIIPTAIAVIDLSYGIIMLFQNTTAALIEIGIGTMIFGIVIALVGLGYQLVAGVIPVILKKLTSLYKYAFTIFKILIFGKKAGRKKDK